MRALNTLLIPLFLAGLFPLAEAAERIQVSRFAASGNYSSALTYGYSRSGRGSGHFIPESGFRTVKRMESCPSLLQSYQHFPLRKMVEVGYLTDAQAKAYAGLGSDLHPTQMTFYTKVDTAAPSNLDPSIEGVLAQDAVGEGKVLASLYSVSSYRFDPVARTSTHVPLPLELEPKWKPVLKAHLPPEKRIFLWEFGRAAQDGAGEIDDLLRAATLGCLNDLFAYAWAMKANFDEVIAHGHVLIHAKDRAHGIAYARRHPTAQIIRHPLDPNDAAFIVPIREMIEKYRPAEVSPVLTKLIDATRGRLNAGQAVMVLGFLKRHRWEELNVAYHGVNGRSEYPIVFSPVTSGAIQGTAITNALLKEFGVPSEDIPEVMRVFGRIEQNFFVNAPGKYVDVTEPGMSSTYYKPRKAQEISNLDPVEVRKNPAYVGSVLTAVYRHFIKLRLGEFDASTAASPEMMLKLDDAFHAAGIRFGITTTDPDVSRVIRAWKPSEVVEHKMVTSGAQDVSTWDPDFQFLTRDVGKTYTMHFFTIEDIHRIGAALMKASGSSSPPSIAASSSWQMFYDLANPEIF